MCRFEILDRENFNFERKSVQIFSDFAYIYIVLYLAEIGTVFGGPFYIEIVSKPSVQNSVTFEGQSENFYLPSSNESYRIEFQD